MGYEEMERDELVGKMLKLANQLIKSPSWELECKLWDMCSDWNRSHRVGLEIFLSEISDDNDNVIGFMIEDEMFYWEK